MLQTLERTNIFDARVLTAAHADALRTLAGPGGLPLLPCLHPALEEGQIVGDYAGQDELQAAAALLPLYAEDPLPTSLRAAGYGADGQGAVLTPPILRVPTSGEGLYPAGAAGSAAAAGADCRAAEPVVCCAAFHVGIQTDGT